MYLPFLSLINMLPFREVAVMDRNSEYRGTSPKELMENAGKALADEISDRFSQRPIIFFCGTGNNGGDAYVAVRYIAETWGDENIFVYLIKGEENVRSDIARKNLNELDNKVIVEQGLNWSRVTDEYIFVDALLGTGVKGEIRGPYRSVIQEINRRPNFILSVDVPSGLGADITVEPELTVTFHDKKEGMSRENSGEIVIKDIGVPSKALDHTGPGEMLLYPSPKEESHKGDNGELLIVGGGPYYGAPVLAAKAAYRTGVDLVHLAIPSSIADIAAGFSPDFIVHPLKGERLNTSHTGDILELSRGCDSMVIGPGLGSEKGTLKAVKRIIEKVDIPQLIDADALKACRRGMVEFNIDTILTPHRGEFEKLVAPQKNKDMEAYADEFALENEVTLLVKKKIDYITDGKRHKRNDFGNEGMTVGGTGDTLSGVVGALMCKGLNPFEAARVGAYMTCTSGERAYEEYSWGLLPDDIIEKIPENFK